MPQEQARKWTDVVLSGSAPQMISLRGCPGPSPRAAAPGGFSLKLTPADMKRKLTKKANDYLKEICLKDFSQRNGPIYVKNAMGNWRQVPHDRHDPPELRHGEQEFYDRTFQAAAFCKMNFIHKHNPKMCNNIKEGKSCPHGRRCRYFHAEPEPRPLDRASLMTFDMRQLLLYMQQMNIIDPVTYDAAWPLFRDGRHDFLALSHEDQMEKVKKLIEVVKKMHKDLKKSPSICSERAASLYRQFQSPLPSRARLGEDNIVFVSFGIECLMKVLGRLVELHTKRKGSPKSLSLS